MPAMLSGSKKHPKVAVILDVTLVSGRNSLLGIGEYVRRHGPWAIYLDRYGWRYSSPNSLQGWRGDGIIARVANKRMALALKETGLPVVDLLGLVPEVQFPLLHIDNAAASRLAAEHLLGKGLRRFAFCGIKGLYWSRIRQAAFAEAVQAAGHACEVFEIPRDIRNTKTWERAETSLAEWLRGLPKPIGIMVCNDPTGQLVLEACRRGGFMVPEKVSVIGVDNDETICMLTDPPLSSVTTNHDHVGFEAAALLDRLMAGADPPEKTVLVPPQGVAARASTDALAIEDAEMAEIVRFVREHACDGIDINDVVRFSGLSRSTLLRNSRKALGRTLHEEINRVRLRRACELLAETDISIDSITKNCGFRHRQYLGKVFMAEHGETLLEYRKRSRHL